MNKDFLQSSCRLNKHRLLYLLRPTSWRRFWFKNSYIQAARSAKVIFIRCLDECSSMGQEVSKNVSFKWNFFLTTRLSVIRNSVLKELYWDSCLAPTIENGFLTEICLDVTALKDAKQQSIMVIELNEVQFSLKSYERFQNRTRVQRELDLKSQV